MLIILSPIAYVISIALIVRYDPNAHTRLEVDRREAIRLASRYASSLGVGVDGWTSGSIVKTDNEKYFYFNSRRAADLSPISRLTPEAYIDIVFISPDNSEKIEVFLSPDGQPLGFSRTIPADMEIPDPGESAARKLAEATLHSLLPEESIRALDPPALKEDRNFSRVSRRYTWRRTFPSLPEAEMEMSITVLGDKVISQLTSTKIDKDYAQKNLINYSRQSVAANLTYYLFAFLISLYGFFRYIQRAREGEVPHARSMLLAAVVASIFMFFAMQTDFLVFNAQTGRNLGILKWFIILTSAWFFVMMGLLLGIAYGGGEGDVREAYPGKLTSLDALITFKLFSRNVARAVIIGASVGGWALLARYLILLPWVYTIGTGQGLSDKRYSILFGQSAWLLPFINPLISGIIAAIVGLLLPLSFLHRRRFRSKKLSLAILILLAFIPSSVVFVDSPFPVAAGLLVAAVMTASVLVPFFAFDLLTVIITITAELLVISIVYLSSQPAASLRQQGGISASIALLFLILEAVFLYRGREYQESEVRPLYARHLAERLGLQAEVSAAREAQIRLMPQKLPEMSGLALAAACRPARVVGGDFYDLFMLDQQKLGVFIAEGGRHGLSAALTIAFAKGFLMPRISGGHSPVELIQSLHHKLTPMLEKNQTLALAYAVVDLKQRTLTYARIGQFPQIIVSQNNGRARRSFQPEERELKINLAPYGAEQFTLREATLPLSSGDAIILFTDGISASINADKRTSLEEWTSGIAAGSKRSSTNELQAALSKALDQQLKRIRKIGIEDDLTAVVVYLKTSEEAS